MKSNKYTIFKIGSGGGKQVSCFNKEYDEKKDIIFKPLIDFNIKILTKYNINYRRINIENRDYLFKKNEEPFENKLHLDSFQDDGNSCITSVYYYHIDKTIKGGEINFHPFLTIKPKPKSILLFDGDWKHKVNKIYGNGLRGTIICSFEKSNL